MFKGTIEKQVMVVVKARIAQAEEAYKSGVDAIEAKAETDKALLATDLVNSVLNFAPQGVTANA